MDVRRFCYGNAVLCPLPLVHIPAVEHGRETVSASIREDMVAGATENQHFQGAFAPGCDRERNLEDRPPWGGRLLNACRREHLICGDQQGKEGRFCRFGLRRRGLQRPGAARAPRTLYLPRPHAMELLVLSDVWCAGS